jgi:hypothetical protein
VSTSDNILIGASQVTAMAGFAERGEFENFADTDIPFPDIELAASSVQHLLDQVYITQPPPLRFPLSLPLHGMA